MQREMLTQRKNQKVKKRTETKQTPIVVQLKRRGNLVAWRSDLWYLDPELSGKETARKMLERAMKFPNDRDKYSDNMILLLRELLLRESLRRKIDKSDSSEKSRYLKDLYNSSSRCRKNGKWLLAFTKEYLSSDLVSSRRKAIAMRHIEAFLPDISEFDKIRGKINELGKTVSEDEVLKMNIQLDIKREAIEQNSNLRLEIPQRVREHLANMTVLELRHVISDFKSKRTQEQNPKTIRMLDSVLKWAEEEMEVKKDRLSNEQRGSGKKSIEQLVEQRVLESPLPRILTLDAQAIQSMSRDELIEVLAEAEQFCVNNVFKDNLNPSSSEILNKANILKEKVADEIYKREQEKEQEMEEADKMGDSLVATMDFF